MVLSKKRKGEGEFLTKNLVMHKASAFLHQNPSSFLHSNQQCDRTSQLKKNFLKRGKLYKEQGYLQKICFLKGVATDEGGIFVIGSTVAIQVQCNGFSYLAAVAVPACCFPSGPTVR